MRSANVVVLPPLSADSALCTTGRFAAAVYLEGDSEWTQSTKVTLSSAARSTLTATGTRPLGVTRLFRYRSPTTLPNHNHRRCRVRWKLAAVRPGQPDHLRPNRERRCVHCSRRHHTAHHLTTSSRIVWSTGVQTSLAAIGSSSVDLGTWVQEAPISINWSGTVGHGFSCKEAGDWRCLTDDLTGLVGGTASWLLPRSSD